MSEFSTFADGEECRDCKALEAKVTKLQLDLMREQNSHYNTAKQAGKWREEQRDENKRLRDLLREAAKVLGEIAKAGGFSTAVDWELVVRLRDEAGKAAE